MMQKAINVASLFFKFASFTVTRTTNRETRSPTKGLGLRKSTSTLCSLHRRFSSRKRNKSMALPACPTPTYTRVRTSTGKGALRKGMFASTCVIYNWFTVVIERKLNCKKKNKKKKGSKNTATKRNDIFGRHSIWNKIKFPLIF